MMMLFLCFLVPVISCKVLEFYRANPGDNIRLDGPVIWLGLGIAIWAAMADLWLLQLIGFLMAAVFATGTSLTLERRD